MQNLRALVLVLLVIGCGAGLLLYFGASDPQVGPSGATPETVAGGAAPAPVTGDTQKSNAVGDRETREAVAKAAEGAGGTTAGQVAVRGRLVAGGAPVTGVSVGFRSMPSTARLRARLEGAESEPTAVADTDAAGRFELRVDRQQSGFLSVASQSVVLKRKSAANRSMRGGGRMVEVAEQDVDLGDLEVLRAARVAGQIIAAGRGIEGVEIVLDLGSALSLMNPALTKTDSDGRFELTGMYPGPVKLSTRSPKFLPATRALELAEGERREGVVIQLEAGGFVTGTVVDDLGKPLPGVKVSAARESRPRAGVEFSGFRPGESTETDASGQFHLAGLAPATARLRATKTGYVAGEVTGIKVGAGAVVVELQRLGRVAGVLVDEAGEPIAGSAVRADTVRRSPGMFIGEPGSTVRTDADGRFELMGVRPGPNTLVATGDAHLPARQAVEVRPGEVHDKLRLVARRGATLTVNVVDHTGQPVANAEVVVARPDQSAASGVPGSGRREIRREVRRERRGGRTVETVIGGAPEALGRGKTDAAGVAVVAGLPAGAVEIKASHAQLALTEPARSDLPDGGDAQCQVKMQRGGFARVTVVDAGGKPSGGASLEVAGPIQGKLEDADKDSHKADDAGEVVVGPLRPGAYRAVLSQAAKPRQMGGGMSFSMLGDTRTLADSAETFEVKPGATVGVKLTRPILTEVRGVVRDAEGVVVGAEVEALAEGGVRMPMGGGNKVRTAADGRFVVTDMPSGKYTLYWNRKGSAVPSQKEFVLATNQALHEEDLKIPGGLIELRAVDRNEGFGIEDAKVTLRRATATPPGGQPAPRRRQAVVMMVGMSASSGGGGASTFRMSSGAESIETDAKGNAVLRDVPAGEYNLTLEHGDYAKVTRKVQLGGDQRKNLGKVQMAEGCRIRGRVQWANPTGLAMAMIEITDVAGGNRDTELARNGSFKFTGLAAGTYKLRARPVTASDWGPAQTVVVGPGRGERVTLEIPAGK